jgi:hypothetical protein
VANCPFCGLYPYEMVDVGIGSVPVAVNCCELGNLLLDGRHASPEMRKIITEAAAEIGNGPATEMQLDRVTERLHALISPPSTTANSR